MDAVEVGLEGVGGALTLGVLGQEGLDDGGGVVGDLLGHLLLGFVGVGRGHEAVGIQDLDFAEEEGGVHDVALLALLGEVHGEALGGLIVTPDDADAPSLVEAEGGLTRADPVDGVLQGVVFYALWVGGLVAHCKKGFWA